MDLIEKEKVIKLLSEYRTFMPQTDEECLINRLLNDIAIEVNNIEPISPTIAHWVDKTDWTGILGYKQCQCSNCEFVKSGRGTAYCERCGAKMTAYAE